MLTDEEDGATTSRFPINISGLGLTLLRQLEAAESASTYKSAAQLCEALMLLTLEQVRFSVNTKSSKHKLKIDVKNVFDYEY